MMIKKMGIATAAFVMCASLPIQTHAMSTETPQNYTMKAEQKIAEYNLGNSATLLKGSGATNVTSLKQQPAEVIKLINGSFEDPAISTTSRTFDASLVPGWETTATDNNIEFQKKL
ncbi:hypothetical protein [Listeria cornellensis]|uniref:Uncharacterized protein n=1 Tax=Listeria cornellensis FSL F6-0969 TaxID=1265820 RepID=W7C046_9LIST|nr:hypothetical protein [Listeria cornellensis]EUJ30530.1 hypothetical protein PCORN_08527 [Listeria cornellensis FSL F6-0969]